MFRFLFFILFVGVIGLDGYSLCQYIAYYIPNFVRILIWHANFYIGKWEVASRICSQLFSVPFFQPEIRIPHYYLDRLEIWKSIRVEAP